jgi:predicted permease
MTWRDLFRRRKDGVDIEDEIESHLQLAVQDRIERGQSPQEARRGALLEFGSVRLVKEDTQAVWSWTALEQLVDDLRTGCRILTRSPGLSATAVALIALVIGGNTTMFSIVHGLLTKPAPGIEADRLVSLGWIVDTQPVHPTDSYPNYLNVAAESRSVRPLLAFQFERFTLALDHGSYAVHGGLVSANYFNTLGLHPVRGRTFTDEESRLDASGLVAVISYRLWQNEFRAAESVIGQAVELNGHPATIVGVSPPRFQGVWLAEMSDVWVPLLGYSRIHGSLALNQGLSGAIGMVGRLAPGITLSQARAEFDAISQHLQASDPESNKKKKVVLFPYSATGAGDSLIAQQGPRFLAIFSIVTMLTLLIVCANVANLMLARAVSRQREMAVRQSFGASRVRIVRILLAEGFVISLTAWGVACLLAVWTSHSIEGLMPPFATGGVPLDVDFAPDWKVVAYAMVLAILGTVAFTVAPALRAWRQDLLPFLRAGEHGIVQGRSSVSSGLVVLQLAFAVLLLTTAGLAYRSLTAIDALDLGFNKNNLLLVTVNTTGTATTSQANGALLDRLVERLRSVPGVGSLSYARRPPQEFWATERVRTDGSQETVPAERNDVGPEYLKVLGLTPVLGRDLAAYERARTSSGAVISQNLADVLWPGQSALGRTMRLVSGQGVEVIGVAPNGFFSGYRREPRPSFVFVSMQQEQPAPGEATFYVRYAGSLDSVVPAIGRGIREVDARVPIVYVRTMDRQLESLTWLVRALTTLLTLFASGSLVIATLGQYAVMVFTMRRRTRDFGVRMALGASSRQILASVLREGLRLTAVGLAIGFVLSLITGSSVRSLLYGVTPTDAATYLGVFSLLALASLVACYLPAHRAARIDPMQALRQE